MPGRSVRVVPVAASSSVSSLSAAFLRAWIRSRSVIEFRGDPTAGLAHGVAGPDLGEDRLGLGGGEVLLGPAGDELEQQLVQLGDHPGVVLTQ